MNHIVPTLSRMLPAALVLTIAAALAPVAYAHGGQVAKTTPATGVSETAATLTGVLGPGGGTRYQFEYGTSRYTAATPIRSIDSSNDDTPVSALVTGLEPGTTYRFRLVALDPDGAGVGGNESFTTGVVPVAPAAPAPIPAPASLPVPTPVIGKTMVVAPVSGVVSVRAPGHAGFTALTAGGSVPVGAVVDTRGGTVQLTSALADGRTQTGTFHGAMFQVRQTASGKGMTDLVLRGGNFTSCPRPRSGATGRAAAVSRRKPPVRRLWSRDSGGRFRTHGRNSVATVRGTRWVTTDTCAGTRTTVTEGAVAVRDLRRKKTVVVRAGHSYVARSRTR